MSEHVKQSLSELIKKRSAPDAWEGVHNPTQLAAQRAGEINTAQDLSQIRVGLLDEIFHCNAPVLVEVDAHSTYCYLLSSAEHQSAYTRSIHLMYACDQGFDPDYFLCWHTGEPPRWCWRQDE